MSARLRVTSYNLLHGMHLARRGVVDLPAAAAVLDSIGADVVALQEVDRDQARSGHTDQVGELAALLAVHGAFCPALLGSPDRAWTPADDDGDGVSGAGGGGAGGAPWERGGGGGDGAPWERGAGGPAYGVGVLSRWPLTALRRVRLPGGGAGQRRAGASLRNPGWDHEPRVALVATVAASPPVEVVVTHLSYLPWRALAQLRVALAAAGAGPAVLAGDLNLPARVVRVAATAAPGPPTAADPADPRTPPGATAAGPTADADPADPRTPPGASDWHDAGRPGWRHAGGQATYPAWRPRLQMHHVLLRGPLAVVDARVHPVTTSDHLPLVVDLEHRPAR